MNVYVLLSVKPQNRCRDDYPEPSDVDRVEVSVHGSLEEAQQAGTKRLQVALGQEDAPDDEKMTLEWYGNWACSDATEQDYQIRVVGVDNYYLKPNLLETYLIDGKPIGKCTAGEVRAWVARQ